MKVLSWNCHYGLSKVKVQALKKVKDVDIMIIQECREPDVNFLNDEFDHLWYGDHIEADCIEDKDLGIGIFWKSDHCTIEAVNYFETMKSHRYILPFNVKYENNKSFILCAVWTKKIRNDKKMEYANYHIPVYEALKNVKFKNENNVILIGDFNTGSNRSKGNKHWYLKLKEKLTKEQYENYANDDEWKLTFFGNQGHVVDDHCFIKNTDLFDKDNSILCIGKKEDWVRDELSDHVPMIISISLMA